jgi:glycosyltransferase involved in cell wall biosynthesis
MKKIGILTTFGSWDEAYSPCNVVKHHLLALVRYGYTPTLFVLDCFPEEFKIEGVDIQRVLPTIKFEPYQGIVQHHNIPNVFEKDIARIVPAMEQAFKDFDILLCQDIIFQDSFLAYNASLRKMVMPKELKLYHWMHSGPSKRLEMGEPMSFLFTLPPQSRLIYMNRYDVVRAAEMYGIYPKDVRVVHNPVDYRLQEGTDDLTDKIISHFGCNEADITAVYPLSTTRMGAGGKQLHKAIKVMAGLKKLGNKVRFIVPNAHANAANEKTEIEKMRNFAKEQGLDPRYELIFTSLIDPKWEHGIPHNVVVQLIRYSDIFLFPTVSENCPLILLEAALGKNLMVLNEDFSPLKDFVGPHALYFKFDSVTTTTNHSGYPDGEDGYFRDCAKIINAELQSNRIYLAYKEIRNKFNIDYIFKKQLEPLFYENWEEEVKAPQGNPALGIPTTGELKPTDQDMLELPPQGMPDILEGEEGYGVPGE